MVNEFIRSVSIVPVSARATGGETRPSKPNVTIRRARYQNFMSKLHVEMCSCPDKQVCLQKFPEECKFSFNTPPFYSLCQDACSWSIMDVRVSSTSRFRDNISRYFVPRITSRLCDEPAQHYERVASVLWAAKKPSAHSSRR